MDEMSLEAEEGGPTRQVVDAEGTDRDGVVTRAPSRCKCCVSSASRAVRVTFVEHRSECGVWGDL